MVRQLCGWPVNGVNSQTVVSQWYAWSVSGCSVCEWSDSGVNGRSVM